MILIQTNSDDPTTDDVLSWLFYLGNNTDVLRVNDIQEVNKVKYNINNQEECFLVQSNNITIDSLFISKFWYKRGMFSFRGIVEKSIYQSQLFCFL